MLEDTGGSSDNNVRLSSQHLRTALGKRDKHNLISGSNLTRHTSNQHNNRVRENIHQSVRGTYAAGMSQFSRDLTNSDVSIRGRRLSPNTECGDQKTATGSESGVRLTVNQAE